jgi:hypothetical protein
MLKTVLRKCNKQYYVSAIYIRIISEGRETRRDLEVNGQTGFKTYEKLNKPVALKVLDLKEEKEQECQIVGHLIC